MEQDLSEHAYAIENISRRRLETPFTANVFEGSFKSGDDDHHHHFDLDEIHTQNQHSLNSDGRSDVLDSSYPSSPLCIEDRIALAQASVAELTPGVSLYDTLGFSCEVGRLAELERMNHVDSIPEARFDTITRLIAAMFAVPVCLVSLVDVNRGWFKSNWGPFPGCVGREGSFCSYITVPDRHEILIIPDCTKDARFAGNPYVAGPPDLRFYTGAPLVTSRGYRIGTLCVCDFKPRHFPAAAYNVYLNFAEMVVRELEKGVVVEDLKKRNSQPIPDSFVMNETTAAASNAANAVETRQEDHHVGDVGDIVADDDEMKATVASLLPSANEPVMLMRTSEDSWPLSYANDAWADMVGLSLEDAQTSSLKELFVPANPSTGWAHIEETLAKGISCTAVMHLRQDLDQFSGSSFNASQQPAYRIRFHLAARDTLKNSVPVGIPGFIAADESWPDTEEHAPALQLESLWICSAQVVWSGTPTSGSASSGSSSSGSYIKRCSPLYKGLGSNRSSIDSDWASSTPTKPAQWSHVAIGPLIGVGGFGRVYRGLLGDSKPVAIKLMEIPIDEISGMIPSDVRQKNASPLRSNENIYEDGGDGMESIQKAVFEAVLSQHLAHPSIVPTMDFSISQSKTGNATQIWIMQHLCDRGNLYDNLDRGFFRESTLLTAPPSIHIIMATALDIASGLLYLHENNIVHGDLSGNNVLLSSSRDERGFKAMLCDFGFSRGLDRQMQTNSIGTMSHMPPELLLEGMLTKKVDTYAFGVLMTELWQGKRAFIGMSPAAIIFHVVSGKMKVTMPSDCPKELKELVDECLDADPDKRPESHDILARLQAMASVVPVGVPGNTTE